MSTLPVADRPETQDSTAPATLATVLRGAMHLAFAVLLSLGVLRALTGDAVPPPLALAVAALVAAIYGTGTALAHRRRDPAEVSTTDLLLPSRGWVAALLGARVVASLVSSAFVWIAFPLAEVIAAAVSLIFYRRARRRDPVLSGECAEPDAAAKAG